MNQLYEERLVSWAAALVFGAMALVLLGTFIHQTLTGQSPELVLLAVILLMVILLVNLAVLTIRIDMAGITVSYGLIRHFTPWKQVGSVYPDNTSNLSYGGFGIRFSTVNGKSRLIFNTLGAPRVVIQQTGAKMQEFAFSTRHPEKVMDAIEFGLGSARWNSQQYENKVQIGKKWF